MNFLYCFFPPAVFYNSEFVLTGVMRQEVDFQSFVFRVPKQTG